MKPFAKGPLIRRDGLVVAAALVASTGIGLFSTARTLAGETTDDRDTIALEFGRLFVPPSFPAHRTRIDLLIHFHGATASVVNSFRAARIDGVLLVINYPGLSSAYRRPFEDRTRFDRVLSKTIDALRDRSLAADRASWNHVCISSFSAGFGAVREILKSPNYFARLDGLLCADSIYAGLEAGTDQRRAEPSHMRDFCRFARLAASGEKTFIVTHSYLHTPDYASTEETADVLIDCVGARRRAVTGERRIGPLRIVSRAEKGNFLLLGCAGDDGQAHMQHLRHIDAWLPMLPLAQYEADPPASTDK